MFPHTSLFYFVILCSLNLIRNKKMFTATQLSQGKPKSGRTVSSLGVNSASCLSAPLQSFGIIGKRSTLSQSHPVSMASARPNPLPNQARWKSHRQTSSDRQPQTEQHLTFSTQADKHFFFFSYSGSFDRRTAERCIIPGRRNLPISSGHAFVRIFYICVPLNSKSHIYIAACKSQRYLCQRNSA